MMSRPSIAALALVAALVNAPGAPRADDFWGAAPTRPEDEEARAEYRRAMAEGDEAAIKLAKWKSDPPDNAFERNRMRRRLPMELQRAVDAYERASEALADEPEPHYRAAELIHRYKLEERRNTPVMRDRDWALRALGHWDRFEELAPLDPRVNDTLFRRALVNTKLADEDGYRRAIAHYETLIRRVDLGTAYRENAAIWLGNLAETYMMVGRLDDAIRTYQRALDFADRAATGYGLAVALDRAERSARAREVMRSYAENDQLRSLMTDDIFFVPQGELDYYLALGHESMGDFELAKQHYQRFIDSGAHPRYQARARDNLAWVEAQRKKQLQKQRAAAPSLPRGLGL